MSTFDGNSIQPPSRIINAHCSRCRRHTVGQIDPIDEGQLGAAIIIWCRSCAEEMEIISKSILAELQNHSPTDPIHECGVRDLDFLFNDAKAMERLFELASEKLHTFPLTGVRLCWRRLYTDTSIAKALTRIPAGRVDVQYNPMPAKALDEVVSMLDMALIMTGGVGREEMIHNLLDELEHGTEPGQELVPQYKFIGPPGKESRALPLRLENEHEAVDEGDSTDKEYFCAIGSGVLRTRHGPGSGDRFSKHRPSKRRKLDLQPHLTYTGQLEPEDYEDGETTGEEDWEAIGAEALKARGGPRDPSGLVAQRAVEKRAIARRQADLLPAEEVSIPSIRHPVPSEPAPSISSFEMHMKVYAAPLVMTGTMRHWPALEKWKSKSYWLEKTFKGKRLVPIEVGRSYTDDGWGQKIVPFSTFLNDYILTNIEADSVVKEEGSSPPLPPASPQGSDEFVPSDKEKNSQSSPLSSPPSSGESAFSNDEARSRDGVKDTHRYDRTEEGRRIKEERGSEQARRSEEDRSSEEGRETGYLAQHDLLRQIPSLRSDIATPDYCFVDSPPPQAGTPVALKLAERRKEQTNHLSQPDVPEGYIESPSDQGKSNNIQSNIWFGPAWTITPLHHDPYHNILCQIVGKKYIRLYSPHESQRLYPRGWERAPSNPKSAQEISDQGTGGLIDMSNNSTIDFAKMELSPAEDWDEVYPGISKVPYTECLLEAGEALYIPIGWWHYVRSCSVGISVSFWW